MRGDLSFTTHTHQLGQSHPQHLSFPIWKWLHTHTVEITKVWRREGFSGVYFHPKQIEADVTSLTTRFKKPAVFSETLCQFTGSQQQPCVTVEKSRTPIPKQELVIAQR